MNQDAGVHRVLETILAALGMNAGYVVDVYERFRADRNLVSPEWRRYFDGLEGGGGDAATLPAAPAPAGAGRASGVAPPPPPPRAPGPGDAAPFLLSPDDILEPLRGGSAVVVRNMEMSLLIPTASSYRAFPVKLLEENRRLLNHHLDLSARGRISFTHLIAWAVIQALKAHPRLNDAFVEVSGVPHRVRRASINLGLAVDLTRRDGSRALLVPNLPGAEGLGFAAFVEAYTRTLDRARTGQLVPGDFQGTTVSLTNPGTVGTTYSVPRLMPGQGAIIATGAIDYAAENRGMSAGTLSDLGVSRRITISCTYDHRIIQGAESGEFLAEIEDLLRGKDGFYDRVFEDLEVPYRPVRWSPDDQGGGRGAGPGDGALKNSRVLQLINAYRVRGHLVADLDPLGSRPQHHPELDPEFHGLTVWDLDRTFYTGGLHVGERTGEEPRATLREILETLRATYCGRIGVEFMNIQDPAQKQWLWERMESARNQEALDAELRRRILAKLIASHHFEKFLHAKYVGHKRFSLEGAETLIVILDQLLEEAAADGVGDVVLGMSHRGRLNVLTQVIGVLYERVFSSFQGARDRYAPQGSGDVKYHLGAAGTHRSTRGGEIRLTLSPNPSHLEAVNPVVEGMVRAKQDRVGGEEGRRRILPVLIHGDAAFAGQGVVAETLNFAQLPGYRTGGTVHVIVNNQIGFTTSVDLARSSPYATDVAKMSQAPVFHVNGDDPEAAVRVVRLAFAFRQTFRKDVVIDMLCYRRHGHNEGDEPSFTQPRMYARIRNRPPVDELYAGKLQAEGVVTAEAVQAFAGGALECVEMSFEKASRDEIAPPRPLSRDEEPGRAGPAVPRPTAVPREILGRIADGLSRVPPDVDVHPKLVKHVTARRGIFASGEGIDWAFAEALAFGSLLLEGVPVRLAGEDSVRGTFSQRHLRLHDDDTDRSWTALQHLAPDQAPFSAIDSPLSEEAVLGFEYGYSLVAPEALVLWEAQFGDFVNEAQVVVDQFLAGTESKWGQASGLVLLLPHGYEGQGPEHSSARMERFLQLAAEDNLQVANCTTPAQYFHLLRRQMCEGIGKPLVVMTPKSLLRHPRAVSTVDDLAGGRFQAVIDDPATGAPARRVVFCSGKVYYDLQRTREKQGVADVAVVRVEQLYPFPAAGLTAVLERHPAADLVWAQEEPRNMGAWAFMKLRTDDAFPPGRRLRYVGRPESASTATGYLVAHHQEQERLLAEALAR